MCFLCSGKNELANSTYFVLKKRLYFYLMIDIELYGKDEANYIANINGVTLTKIIPDHSSRF